MPDDLHVDELFEETGALLQGHFQLHPGIHTDVYIDKFRFLQYPEHVTRLATAIVEKCKDLKVDVVVGPPTGGILLSHEVARLLGCRSAYVKRLNGEIILGPGYSIDRGENVLIVEDVAVTGATLKDVVRLVQAHQGHISAIALVVDRTGGEIDLGAKRISLVSLGARTFEADRCPFCRDGVPLTKPENEVRFNSLDD